MVTPYWTLSPTTRIRAMGSVKRRPRYVDIARSTSGERAQDLAILN